MKPNQELPVTFAKITIAELAVIRATIEEFMELFVVDFAKRNNIQIEDMKNQFKTRRDAKHVVYYQHYLKELGFDKDA
ncbi:MAG: hypothetical protein DME24_06640 [Verrucomicrobia bacterium]|nr:MAG: hypothetical protein DME24_06640 [Verrucomicrobiota bacterium]